MPRCRGQAGTSTLRSPGGNLTERAQRSRKVLLGRPGRVTAAARGALKVVVIPRISPTADRTFFLPHSGPRKGGRPANPEPLRGESLWEFLRDPARSRKFGTAPPPPGVWTACPNCATSASLHERALAVLSGRPRRAVDRDPPGRPRRRRRPPRRPALPSAPHPGAHPQGHSQDPAVPGPAHQL